MPEVDLVAKLSALALVGAMVGVIVLYHAWLDRLRGRSAAGRRSASAAPGPPASVAGSSATGPGRDGGRIAPVPVDAQRATSADGRRR
jgi:hypothetical protein